VISDIARSIFSCSFYRLCAGKMIFVIRLTLHREVGNHWSFGSAIALAQRVPPPNRHYPTHLKIGHSHSIKWYQDSRLIGDFIECILFSHSPQKPLTKENFTFVPATRLASHFHSISVGVELAC
jgi:hypothetical protein